MSLREEILTWKSFCKYGFSIFLFLALGSPANAVTVSSPDGRLVLTIDTTTDGANPPTAHLVYQLSFRGKLLVEPSALRLDLEGQPPLGSNMQIVNTTASSEDHTYKLVTGKASQVRDQYIWQSRWRSRQSSDRAATAHGGPGRGLDGNHRGQPARYSSMYLTNPSG